MEKTVKAFLVFCLVPFILLLVQVGLRSVPVQESVTYDGSIVHIHFENWITALGLDLWLESIFYFAISFQGVFAIILLLQSRRKRTKIFDKMLLLSLFFCIALPWVLDALHFPFIIYGSIAILLGCQCIILGDVWQKEEDEANIEKIVREYRKSHEE